ncbi:C-Jun-amino-terminal kinase-interacting, partial [Brachionus plicatilis]
PFPKRKEIQQKQRAFFKELTTKWEKKKINEARAFYEETESIHDLRISYACFVNDKEIWVCSGKQAEGIVMVANTETRKMAVQNFNTDCKVLCMVFLEDFNMILMGLISKELVAYDSQMKHYLWSIKLKEPILHMFSVKDGIQGYRLYCGLANGFLTYIELNSISQPCDI